MFEKYTERAVVIIATAQDISRDMKHSRVFPEHILLSLFINSSGICAKLFDLYKINEENLRQEIQRNLYSHRVMKAPVDIKFAKETTDMLSSIMQVVNDFGAQSVRPEHIFLILLTESENVRKLLSSMGFGVDNAQKVLLTLLIKKTNKSVYHPEEFEISDNAAASQSVLAMLDETKTRQLFQSALSKLSTEGYEILGTEQILQSILDSESELQKVLNSFGVTLEEYNERLKKISSREDEFCGRQIIFTPNAFKSVLIAVETAKELGSAELKPEHILLGILKNKSGIAYNLINSFRIDEDDLEEKILKSVEREMNETLMILRFAKEEAIKFGTNIVGTEMILLGIIIESYGVGARTLTKLGITLHDVRSELAKIIKKGNDDFDIELSFSKRAKKVLEIAWEFAQKYNKTSINSEDLLMGIVSQESCVAMQLLTTLGADIVEIKQGIYNELEN